jgi:4-hydroxy-3-methylbut-2-enyl diphosphate reductase IspH
MTNQHKLILAAAAALIVGFAVGALWQYTSARGYAQQLRSTQAELSFKRMEATLGTATIEAQRGSHEIARQFASDFFSRLQSDIGQATGERRQALQEILQQRDAMITALSRGDPQSGALLAQLFMRYRIALGEPVGPMDSVASPPPAEQPDTSTHS